MKSNEDAASWSAAGHLGAVIRVPADAATARRPCTSHRSRAVQVLGSPADALRACARLCVVVGGWSTRDFPTSSSRRVWCSAVAARGRALFLRRFGDVVPSFSSVRRRWRSDELSMFSQRIFALDMAASPRAAAAASLSSPIPSSPQAQASGSKTSVRSRSAPSKARSLTPSHFAAQQAALRAGEVGFVCLAAGQGLMRVGVLCEG